MPADDDGYRSLGRRVTRLIGAFAGGLAAVVGLTAPAFAADGLDVATDSTFAYDPAAASVHVTVDATLHNTKPDERSGNAVRRFFYSTAALPLPSSALDVQATTGGRDATVDIETVNDRVSRAIVKLDSNLFYGETRRVQLRYDLRSEVPRTKTFVRVNPAYASFVAYGAGDVGKVSVTVTVPAGFDIETLGDDVDRAVSGGLTVLTSGPIADPAEWYVAVSARNDSFLTRKELDVDGRPMSIASWPNDPAWAAFVERDLAEGVPALEKLIGTPWPVHDRLAIVETITPYLRGYAGWYLVKQNKIEVGEDLDDRTLLHELSHAWFNRDLFASRWMSEGLAEEYSALALAATGGTAPTPDAVDTTSKNAVRLEEWSSPRRRESANDTEAWGYNASWSVMHDLVAEIGTDGMAKVVGAASADTMAYVPGESTTATNDWKRLLDLLEELGGSTKADALFRADVVATDQFAKLDERAGARAKRAELATAGGPWAVPAGVPRALEAWDFDRAQSEMRDANAVLVVREQLAAAAEGAGLSPVSSEAAYESVVDDFGPVRAGLERQLASIGTISAARARVALPRTFAQRMGMIGRTPQVELDRAVEAFASDDTATADAAAARAVALVDTSGTLGRRRITVASVSAGGGLVLLAGSGVLGVRGRRRRRARRWAAVAGPATASLWPAAGEVGSPLAAPWSFPPPVAPESNGVGSLERALALPSDPTLGAPPVVPPPPAPWSVPPPPVAAGSGRVGSPERAPACPSDPALDAPPPAGPPPSPWSFPSPDPPDG